MARRAADLVLTAAAAAAAAPTVIALDCRALWSGFRFLVVAPSEDLLGCGVGALAGRGASALASTGPHICAVEFNPAPGAAPAPAPTDPAVDAAAPGAVVGRPVPDGEYADLPDSGSWLVHIDDDRTPPDDDGLLGVGAGAGVGENALGAERVESSVPGGYPAVTDRDEGACVEDDGVLHTESRIPASLGAGVRSEYRDGANPVGE